MDLFDLYARIVLDTSDYEKGVKESTTGFKKLESGISNVKKVAAGISAAVATVSAFLAKAGIEAAAEVRAETSAFQQTFGDMADVATEAIGRVADESGILQTRLNTLGSKIYAFARASGGEVDESMSLMERALKAAADSAAYYDTSVEQATETLQSFLKGNFENDAALGLSATETTRNAKAMELFGQKYAELTEIRKQETLLGMVEDAQRLSGAIGQAAREADGWENVIGNLKEAWRQLQSKMGEPILDMATPIIQKETDYVVSLTKNWDKMEVSINRVSDATKIAAEVAAAFATGFAVQAIIVKFQKARVAISLLTMQLENTTLAQAALNGTMKIGETVVALLTGKMTLAALAQAAMTKAQAGLNAVMTANPIALAKD